MLSLSLLKSKKKSGTSFSDKKKLGLTTCSTYPGGSFLLWKSMVSNFFYFRNKSLFFNLWEKLENFPETKPINECVLSLEVTDIILLYWYYIMVDSIGNKGDTADSDGIMSGRNNGSFCPMNKTSHFLLWPFQ